MIERAGDGSFRIRLGEGERALLLTLARELEGLLGAETRDPGLRRLFPPAYDDDAGETEYRRLMDAELLEGRRTSLQVLAETAASRETLQREELDAWLLALNDLRLVLGTRLDVQEELYEEGFDPTHPHADGLAVYAYLTWLQETAVAAAAE